MDKSVARVGIKNELCSPSCDRCVDSCPVDILRKPENGRVYVAYPDDCMSCFLCEEECPAEAIQVLAPTKVSMIEKIYPLNSSKEGR